MNKITLLAIIFCCCLASLLSACGQTGALYLPSKSAPTPSHVSAHE